MLALKVGVDRAEFHRMLGAAMPALDGASLSFSISGNVLDPSAQGASGVGLPAIDAVMEISASIETPLGTIADRLQGIGGRIAAQLDLSGSGILAGTEYIVMPGEGPVMLFCPLRRLERLSRQEFQHYWLDVHAEFGRRPDNRYRQFHTDDATTVIAAAAAGVPASNFDGIALAYFDDLDHLRSKLSSPEIAGDAFADEQRFIDHARSQFLPFTAAKHSRT
jgi:hypothetical protein